MPPSPISASTRYFRATVCPRYASPSCSRGSAFRRPRRTGRGGWSRWRRTGSSRPKGDAPLLGQGRKAAWYAPDAHRCQDGLLPSLRSPNPDDRERCSRCGASLPGGRMVMARPERQPRPQVSFRVVRADGGPESVPHERRHAYLRPRSATSRSPMTRSSCPVQARFFFSGQRLAIEDVGGGNGVFARLSQERELPVGGELRLGRQRLLLEPISSGTPGGAARILGLAGPRLPAAAGPAISRAACGAPPSCLTRGRQPAGPRAGRHHLPRPTASSPGGTRVLKVRGDRAHGEGRRLLQRDLHPRSPRPPSSTTATTSSSAASCSAWSSAAEPGPLASPCGPPCPPPLPTAPRWRRRSGALGPGARARRSACGGQRGLGGLQPLPGRAARPGRVRFYLATVSSPWRGSSAG